VSDIVVEQSSSQKAPQRKQGCASHYRREESATRAIYFTYLLCPRLCWCLLVCHQGHKQRLTHLDAKGGCDFGDRPMLWPRRRRRRPPLPLPEREAQSSEVRGPPDRSEGPHLQSEGAKIGVGAGPWAGDDRKVFFPVKLLNAGDRRSGEEQRETPPGPRQVPDLAARRESDAGRRHDEPAAVSAGRKVVASAVMMSRQLSRRGERSLQDSYLTFRPKTEGLRRNCT